MCFSFLFFLFVDFFIFILIIDWEFFWVEDILLMRLRKVEVFIVLVLYIGNSRLNEFLNEFFYFFYFNNKEIFFLKS